MLLPPDPSIELTLKATQLKYSRKDGNLVLDISLENSKRKQKVFIKTDPEVFRTIQGFEVYSPIFQSKFEPTIESLQNVLLRKFELGGVVYQRQESNYRFRFRVFVGPNVTASSLKTVVEQIAKDADGLEKELNPGKEDQF